MRQDWSIEAAVFYRWDDNLVDWTFAGTSAREANPVDIETFGFELIASKRWDSIETIASYTFLDKDEDNALRKSSDFALFTHFGLSIYPTQVEGLEIFFAIDNAWDDDFEDVPGTPGRGDQYSAGVTFSW